MKVKKKLIQFVIFICFYALLLNSKYFIYLFLKVRTRVNLIVLNIIISDLIISSIGIFLDVMGIVGVVGTSIQNGTHIGRGLCQLEGFIYIITGKIN